MLRLLLLLIALAGWPVGKLIARSTKEEIKAGRKYFKIAASALSGALFGVLLFALATSFDDVVLLLLTSLAFMLLLVLAALHSAK